MSNAAVRALEGVSGIEKRRAESIPEYLDRLARAADIDEETVSRTKAYVSKTASSSSSNGDASVDEADALDEFLSTVDGLDERDRGGDPPGSDGIEIDDENDDRSSETEDDAGTTTETVSSSPTSPTSSTRSEPSPPVSPAENIRPDGGGEEANARSTSSRTSTSTEEPATASADDRRSNRLRTAVSTALSGTVRGPFQELDRRVRSRVDSPEPIDVCWVLAIVALGAYVFVQSVGHRPLLNWDEAIYANAARHMAQNGEWVIPHLYWHPQKPDVVFQPFLEKPPLVFWLQGISMELFGVSRFAVRLPIASLAILSGLLAYRFGTRLYGRTAGITATVVLFTTPLIYAGSRGGRTGSTDVPLLFFGTVFVYVAWIALTDDRPDLLPYVGIAAALAVLVKGFHAGVFVIAVAPLALWHYRTFLSRKTVAMVGVTSIVALPWPIFAWLRYGDEFLYQIFYNQVLERATGESFVSRPGTFSFMRYPYFQRFPDHFEPWVMLLFPAVVVALSYGRRKNDLETPLFLLWWGASTFGFFVLTGNHGWYVMPMFVPCALLIGSAATAMIDPELPEVVAIGIGLGALVWTTGISIATVTICIAAVALSQSTRIREFATDGPSENGYRIAREGVSILFAGLIVLSLVGSVPLASGGPGYSSEERLGLLVSDEVPDDEAIFVDESLPNAFAFSFFAQRPAESVSTTELNTDADVRYALVADDTLEQLDRDGTVVGVGDGMAVIELEDPTSA